MKNRKKYVWMAVLVMILIATVGFFWITDRLFFMGVPVVSEEKITGIVANRIYMAKADNLSSILLYEGVEIPYDRETNTFYLSQELADGNAVGKLGSTGENVSLYIKNDGYVNQKKKAETESHRYQLYVMTEDSYTCTNLVLSGLPVLAFNWNEGITQALKNTEEGESTEHPNYGRVLVYSPMDREINKPSEKSIAASMKASQNVRKYTLKLYANDYESTKKVSLLDLEKGSEWKLTPVLEDTTYMREKLASDIWSTICRTNEIETAYVADKKYVEVIINQKYQGLYLLWRPQEPNEWNMTEQDLSYETDSMLEPTAMDIYYGYEVNGTQEAKKAGRLTFTPLLEYVSLTKETNAPEIFAEKMNVSNIIDYNIFLEVTGNAKSVQKSRYIVAKHQNETDTYVYFKVPKKFAQSFTYEESGKLPEDKDFLYMKENFDGADKAIAKRWKVLSGQFLSKREIDRQLAAYQKKLVNSGVLERIGGSKTIEDACKDMGSQIGTRLDELNQYYSLEK